MLSDVVMPCIISAQWESLSVADDTGRASAPRSGAKASANVMNNSSNVRKRPVIVVRLVPLWLINQVLKGVPYSMKQSAGLVPPFKFISLRGLRGCVLFVDAAR